MEPVSTPSSVSNQVEAIKARIQQKRRDRTKVLDNRSVETSSGQVEARIDAPQTRVPAPYTRAQRLQNFVDQFKNSEPASISAPATATKVVKKVPPIKGRLTRPDTPTPAQQAAAQKSNQEIADAIEAFDSARRRHTSLVAEKKLTPEHEAGFRDSDVAPTTQQLVESISSAIATELTDLKLESNVTGVDASRADVAFAEPETETNVPAIVSSPRISTGFANAASKMPTAVNPTAAAPSVSAFSPAKPAAAEPSPAKPVAAKPSAAKPDTIEVVDSELFNVGAFIAVDVAAWDVESFVWPKIVDQFLDVGEQAISRLANFSMDILDGSQHRLAVTSVTSGAGVSTIACSITRWAAKMKKRVLLVDGNIKQPSLAASIGLPPNISWVNVVRESLNPAEAIIRCKSTGVCVMPLGNISNRQTLPSTLLDHLGELLNGVQHSFDLIVVDVGQARYLPQELSASDKMIDAAMIVDANVGSASFRQAKEDLLRFGITKFVAAQNSI